MPLFSSKKSSSFSSNDAVSPNRGGEQESADDTVDRSNAIVTNSLVRDNAKETLKLLRSVNEAQSLKQNLQRLQKVGGVTALAKFHLYIDQDVDGEWHGVSTKTVDTRRQYYGHNSLPGVPRKSFSELFMDTFQDATLQILMVAAVVSLAVGMYDDPTTGYVEGCAILSACLIVSFVTAANDYQKESQFRELSTVNDECVDVVVIRNGTHWQIPIIEIVVGDIVCIESGNEIPCDGILLSCDQLEIDESALTGEPIDVDKSIDDDPFVLSGCTVQSGSGQFLAIAVGKESQWGIIKSHLETEQQQTPLQQKLDDMAAMIGYVGMGAAFATFITMMFIKIVIQPEYLNEHSILSYTLESFIIGVTIVVVAVPEGLPLAVTISLAFSTKKMLADQCLIRHLAACETMGNATNICSDKTGTLTENKMTVVKGIFADTRCDDTIHRVPVLISPIALNVILEGIACCSTARIVPSKQDNERPTVIGNKTEGALLLLAQSDWSGSGYQNDIDERRSRARFGKVNGSRLFPFTSSRKRMSVLINYPKGTNPTTPFLSKYSKNRINTHQYPQDSLSMTNNNSYSTSSQTWTLYHKGAAEVILMNCTHYLDIDGSEKVLSIKKRSEFERIIKKFASNALRCVAMAHRNNVQHLVDPETCTQNECESKLENNMCLDAITGIMDPLRPDVIEAIAICKRAGILVRMVTGDNLDTAEEIARMAGILTHGGISMLGEDFRKLTPKQLDDILPKLQVLARSSPEDKHILVQRLNGALIPSTKEEWLEKHRNRNFELEKDLLLPGYKDEWDIAMDRNGYGEVVGVTGDGTNDGPALKAADVGLSMGMSGTDVAKKASDIIIMDDNFSSIVKAVLWGRSVFDNIRKFLQFQLTVNVVALTITFLSAVAGYKPPLNAVMMLWVNLIMDTMGALALGTEPPNKELLERRPYKRDASLISRPMWRNILCQATYQLIILVFLLNRGPQMFHCTDGSNHHFTIIFNAFVFCQVFNEFNAREIGDRFDPIRSLHQSPIFLLVIVFTIVAQWFIIEFGGDFTQTYPLSYAEWKFTVLLGAGSIPVGYIMRRIPVTEDPHSFAGIERKNKDGKKKPSARSFLTALVIVLVPVFGAIVYQLYYEIIEFIRNPKKIVN